VDLKKVTWVLSGDEHVAEFVPPPNVVPLERGRKMADLVISGELPAAVNIEIDHPDGKPLSPDAREAGFEALRSRGHYPINHAIVVKDEVLAAHPEVAADLFRAFAESKRRYVEKLRAGTIEKPTAMDEMHRRVIEITGGDPLPYGIAPNRGPLGGAGGIGEGAGHHQPRVRAGGALRSRDARAGGMMEAGGQGATGP
jgi:hypothetical protein